jgi:hypothetical protein
MTTSTWLTEVTTALRHRVPGPRTGQSATGAPEPGKDHGPLGRVLRVDHTLEEPPGNAGILWQLQAFLEGYVPWVIEDCRRRSSAYLDRERLAALDQIAHHGDVLMYGGPGATQARIALGKAFGITAASEGGITLLGVHACTREHPGCPGGPKA